MMPNPNTNKNKKSPTDSLEFEAKEMNIAIREMATQQAMHLVQVVLTHNSKVRDIMTIPKLRRFAGITERQNVANIYISACKYLEVFLKSLHENASMISTMSMLQEAGIDIRDLDEGAARAMADGIADKLAQKLQKEAQDFADLFSSSSNNDDNDDHNKNKRKEKDNKEEEEEGSN